MATGWIFRDTQFCQVFEGLGGYLGIRSKGSYLKVLECAFQAQIPHGAPLIPEIGVGVSKNGFGSDSFGSCSGEPGLLEIEWFLGGSGLERHTQAPSTIAL